MTEEECQQIRLRKKERKYFRISLSNSNEADCELSSFFGAYHVVLCQ